jgi:antagonist of KipI
MPFDLRLFLGHPSRTSAEGAVGLEKMSILVKDPGFATTVQDLGRYGYSHLGISPAGAADSLSFRIANLVVGNDENAPALEMTLTGAMLQFEEPAMIAITGAECSVEADGRREDRAQSIQLEAGSLVKIGHIALGARAYLAVQGGIDVPLVMGSASTHLSARFGGLEGRSLRRGDRLQVRQNSGLHSRVVRDGALPLVGVRTHTALRITRGSQQDWFDSDALATLLSSPFCVSDQSGRTGLRLTGSTIHPQNTAQLLTDGVPLGAIQIPPDGQPIILFVDQQTTGGYPKIANVIAADLHLVGQLRARDTVRFAEVRIQHAIELLREQEMWLKEIFAD